MKINGSEVFIGSGKTLLNTRQTFCPSPVSGYFVFLMYFAYSVEYYLHWLYHHLSLSPSASLSVVNTYNIFGLKKIRSSGPFLLFLKKLFKQGCRKNYSVCLLQLLYVKQSTPFSSHEYQGQTKEGTKSSKRARGNGRDGGQQLFKNGQFLNRLLI